MREIVNAVENPFGGPQKKNTSTQGMILVKMIEKEMDMPFYDVIREIKGGWTAFYYNTTGLFYGYRLREGYHVGDNRILDMVLEDYNLSPKRK